MKCCRVLQLLFGVKEFHLKLFRNEAVGLQDLRLLSYTEQILFNDPVSLQI